MSISKANFFQNYFCGVKTGEVEMNCHRRIDGYTNNNLVIVRLPPPEHFRNFCSVFLPNIGEDRKKSYYLSGWPLALCHMVNPAQVIALRS